MKKYVLNKNLTFNGNHHLKGTEIKEGEAGFNLITGAGHTDVIDVPEAKAEPMKTEAPIAQPKYDYASESKPIVSQKRKSK